MNTRQNIRLVDTTLRDGEQAPGVCFSPSVKMEILKNLYDAGIREFEIGTPAIGKTEREAIRMMLALHLEANLSVWCRATLVDLEMAYNCGAQRVNLSLPVSQKQMHAIGKNEAWVLEQLKTCLDYASSHFDFITVGAQDGSRAESEFLHTYIKLAISYPRVQRIRIADTVGIMNPFSVVELFQNLKAAYPFTEFEFHGHNDLGMANANGLAAIKGGAQLVSVTVNGLGERCGNTPLEELVIALNYSEGIDLGIDKKLLQEVCRKVAVLSSREIPISKPFNGEHCFMHESGIHTRSLLVDKLSYQPFDPEEVGAKTHFLFGKHSGGAAIKALLNKSGIFCSNSDIEFVLRKIKSKAEFVSGGFTGADILKIYYNNFSRPIFKGGEPCKMSI